MARAFGRVLDGYSERHHMVPRAFGGSNDSSNIVRLTYREHFIAHWLLTKFTTGRDRIKMLHALHRMGHAESRDKKVIVAGWQYAVARKAQRDAVLGLTRSPETRARMSAANVALPRGIAVNGRRPMSDVERNALAQRNRDRVFTPEVRVNLSKAQLGKRASADTLAKMSKAQTGRVHPEHTKKKMSMSAFRRWAKPNAAIHCAVLSFGA